MNKNNLIRFAQSLVFLPIMTGTLPLNDVLHTNVKEGFQTVFTQKENIVAEGLFSINQVINPEVKDLEAKAKAIDDYFKSYNMPLAGTGKKMVEEAEKNDLDWRLLPAIAVRESTGGIHQCKKVGFNPFGWGSCKIGFKSYDQAIETVARNLGGNNPNTKHHYHDKETLEILKAYNPPSIVPKYAEQVISIMNKIGNEDINLVTKTIINS